MTIEVKYEGKFDADLLNVCALLNEVQLYQKWMPFCVDSKVVRVSDTLDKDAYIKFKIPFINERYLFFHAIGLDRIESTNSVLVFCEGINIPMPITPQDIK